MTIKYIYGLQVYETLAEAEAAQATQQLRWQNNPTDWIVVKEISGSQETGWVMNPVRLNDSQILNLDETKKYSVYSDVTGENLMPLTSTEVTAKVEEYRQYYSNSMYMNSIQEVDITPEMEAVMTAAEPKPDISA
jgi:hypothetical protein